MALTHGDFTKNSEPRPTSSELRAGRMGDTNLLQRRLEELFWVAAEPVWSDEHQDACVANKEAETQGAGKQKKDGVPKRGGGKVKEDRQTLSGFNRRTGKRNRRYR